MDKNNGNGKPRLIQQQEPKKRPGFEEKRKKLFAMSDGVGTTCPECGEELRYLWRGTYECVACGVRQYNDFGKINKYIEDNGPSPASAISRGTGVPLYVVNNYYVDGKLVEYGDVEGKLGTKRALERRAAENKQNASHGFSVGGGQAADDAMHFIGRDKKL